MGAYIKYKIFNYKLLLTFYKMENWNSSLSELLCPLKSPFRLNFKHVKVKRRTELKLFSKERGNVWWGVQPPLTKKLLFFLVLNYSKFPSQEYICSFKKEKEKNNWKSRKIQFNFKTQGEAIPPTGTYIDLQIL